MSDDPQPDLESAYALDGPKSAERLYANWAESYDAEFADPTGYQPPSRVAARFAECGGTGPVLDAGCGTGLVGDHLQPDILVDGVDISPEMLDHARNKGRYRNLMKADLTAQPLRIDGGPWNGLVSAGTFTHGHVGPEALCDLVSLLSPEALVVIAVNKAFAERSGLDAVLATLQTRDRITEPQHLEEPIYTGAAPPGHERDTMLLLDFHIKA